MRYRALWLAALPVLLLAALVPLILAGASAQPTRRVPVVTSTSVFTDMIERVGGDHVEVFGLVPAGADVHTFQPTPQDMQRASRARVAIWNGLGLDEMAERTVASLDQADDLITIHLADGIEPILDAAHDDEEGEEGHAGNPHLWLVPTYAMVYVQQIRDSLAEADPDNSAAYHANAAQYLGEIAELGAWALQEVSTIPVERRKLVTFHDAFPYLARHLGLELVGVVLKSPGREPSAQEVAELVSQIQAHQIPAVYAEPQLNARILELAARDAHVQVRLLYSDTLDGNVKSYLELMRYNVASLVEGLR